MVYKVRVPDETRIFASSGSPERNHPVRRIRRISEVVGGGRSRIVQGMVTPQSPQNHPSDTTQRKAPHRSHFLGSSESYRQPTYASPTFVETKLRSNQN
jgi:hypothetical protein